MGIIASCADDTEVGYGLLGEEDLELRFSDDFNLPTRHIGPRPVEALNGSFHSLGTLNDPRFGKMTASFYVRPFLSSFSPPPEFGGGTFDSVILALQIDTSRIYGDPDALFDVSVFSLTESIDILDSTTSDQVFTTEFEPVGTLPKLVPSQLDSLPLTNELRDTVFFQNVITIKLNGRFGSRIFTDTANNKTSSGFASLLDGFLIRAESNNALVQVDLNSPVSGMIFYYRDSSDVSRIYPYEFSRNRPLNFEYDLAGSVISDLIESNDDDEFIYLQGHAGTMIEFDISDLTKIDEPFVNFATLEVVAQRQGFIDTSKFALPPALDFLKLNEDGIFEDVIDLSLGKSIGQVQGFFDGEIDIDIDEEVVRYEMNITTYIKEFLKGAEESKIYLTVRNRVDNPNNVILYGSNHPTYRPRLNLTYTKS